MEISGKGRNESWALCSQKHDFATASGCLNQGRKEGRREGEKKKETKSYSNGYC